MQNRIAGEYIVVLKDELPSSVNSVAEELAAASGGRRLAIFQHGIKGFGLIAVEAQAKALAQHPLVEFVEESSAGQLAASQQLPFGSDPEYVTYWGLDRTDDQWSPWSRNYYYNYANTGSGVRIFVIDSGIKASHTEFTNTTIEGGWNFSGDTHPATNPGGGDSWPLNSGHGTAVASVIAGKTAGVAKQATLIPLKVVACYPDQVGGTGSSPISSLGAIYSLDYVINDMLYRIPRRAVVNLSIVWDARPGSNDANELCDGVNCRSAMEHNIVRIVELGIPVVVAAGNANQDANNWSPARIGFGNEQEISTGDDNLRAITVGGTTINDARWVCQGAECVGFGAFPPASNIGNAVSVWAPAWNIRTADISNNFDYRDSDDIGAGTNYSDFTTPIAIRSGTSFSAAFVTGILARQIQGAAASTVRTKFDTLLANSTYVGDVDGIPVDLIDDHVVTRSSSQ